MPRGKRKLSRKGCSSCKKLKIKCDEAKPACEYCAHTGRDCVYPDVISKPVSKISSTSEIYEIPADISPFSVTINEFLADVADVTDAPEVAVSPRDFPGIHFREDQTRSPALSLAESYEASIYGEDEDDDPSFDTGFLGRIQSPRSFNSMGAQMHMTRFELRLLRFFHDECIPYVTFKSNKRADYIWRTIFPTYFASSNLVRQATYAMSCLFLWPTTSLQALLEMDNRACELQVTSSTVQDETEPFLHIFDKLSIFDKSDESIFTVTTAYFISTLQESQQIMSESQKNHNILTYEDLATIYFSGFLIFSYAGVHPHCVLPLVDFDSEAPTDFIGFFSSMRKVFLLVPSELKESIVDTLMEYAFLTPTAESEKIGFVEVLRGQLKEHYFANTAFSEIDSKICEENACLKRCLFLLECCYLSAIRECHPTPLFKFLALLEEDFIILARQKNYFALRVLFVFCCISIFCQFHLSFHENIWVQYVDYFMQNFSPLGTSDAALHEYVLTNHTLADPNKFTHDMRKLNRLSFEFGGLEVGAMGDREHGRWGVSKGNLGMSRASSAEPFHVNH